MLLAIVLSALAIGIGVYRFSFTRWKSGDYGYLDDNRMNMLMTSVEKAFLQLDPNAGIRPFDLNVKTKYSIF